MWRLLVLTAILVLASGNILVLSKTLNKGRIVGGEAIHISDVPYQVSVRLNNEHFCGGSILNRRVVLTAAHCIIEFGADAASSYSIQYGTAEIGGNHNTIKADRLLKHENFSLDTLDYDIALIYLSSEILLSNNTQSVRLAIEEPSPGTHAFIFGWGKLSEHGSTTTILRKVGVEIFNRTQCTEIYKTHKYKITDRMICDNVHNGGKASCQGDSGGSVVSYRNNVPELVGIVSWAEGCARQDYPGVKSNVANLLDWILKNLKVA